MYFHSACNSPRGERKENPYDNKPELELYSFPQIMSYPVLLSLTKGCLNNTTQYEAVVTRLELAL